MREAPVLLVILEYTSNNQKAVCITEHCLKKNHGQWSIHVIPTLRSQKQGDHHELENIVSNVENPRSVRVIQHDPVSGPFPSLGCLGG